MIPQSSANVRVVVGIPTRDRCDELRKAIASALDQSYSPLRIMVCDDASGDGTPKLRDEFKNVSWQRCEQAQGSVKARNKMMLTAVDDYYVSLDDDSWFITGDEIAVAVDYLERQPRVAAVAFDILAPDRPQPMPRGARHSVETFIGCGHILRLSTVKALGGYAEFSGSYGSEEKDLCLRLIDAGYEIVRMVGVHVWHQRTMTARDLADQHTSGVCNDLTFALRRVPLGLLLPVLGYKLVSQIAFSVRYGLVRPCIGGIVAFARASAKTWRTRKPVRWSSFWRYQALARAPREVAG